MQQEASPTGPMPPQQLVENGGMGTGGTPRFVWGEFAALQATKNARLFQVLAEHQRTVMEHLVTSQTQMNTKLWERVTASLEQ